MPGYVGVAPATITMYVPNHGSPVMLGQAVQQQVDQLVADARARQTPGWINGKPVSPGVPVLPDMWQQSKYYGYLPAVKGWITPGFGAITEDLDGAETNLGEYALSGAGELGAGSVVLGALGAGLMAGLVALVGLHAAGAKRPNVGALAWGGSTAVVGVIAGAIAIAVRK